MASTGDRVGSGLVGRQLIVLGDFRTGSLDRAGALPGTDDVSADLINDTTNLPEPERYTIAARP